MLYYNDTNLAEVNETLSKLRTVGKKKTLPFNNVIDLLLNSTQNLPNISTTIHAPINTTTSVVSGVLNTTLNIIDSTTQGTFNTTSHILHSTSPAILNTTNETYNKLSVTLAAKQNVLSMRDFEWIDIMLIVSFVLVFIVGITGNSLVCYFFKYNQNRLRGMARMIYYLAIVDLLASIVNPALYLYWQVTFNRKWHFGYLGCKILPVLAKCSITISCGIILLITIDRCMVISRPFHPQMKDKHLKVALLLIIVYSILCETPMIVYSEIHPQFTCLVPNLRVDGFFWPTIIIYISRDVIFLVTFIITVVIIYLELYNKASANTLKQQKDMRRNKNVMQMLITLAVVFIFLVFPREILHIVYMMSWKFGNGIPHSDVIRNVNAFFKVLHMCNSICNVFIYAGLHGRFRHKLIRFLFKLVGKQYMGNNITMNMSESGYDCDKASIDKANSPLVKENSTYFKYKDTSMNGF